MNNNNPFKPSVHFHPGYTLSDKLEEMNISVSDFSKLTNLSEDTIMGIITTNKTVTPDIAEALEMGTKIPKQMWLNKQKNYTNWLMGNDF